MTTEAAGPDGGPFEVRAQLTPTAAVVGVWESRLTASRKRREWAELYGAARVSMSVREEGDSR